MCQGWVQLLQVQEPLLAKQIFQERYKVGLRYETQHGDFQLFPSFLLMQESI